LDCWKTLRDGSEKLGIIAREEGCFDNTAAGLKELKEIVNWQIGRG